MKEEINNTDLRKPEWTFATVFDRMEMLKEYKDRLSNVFAAFDQARSVTSKVEKGAIITKDEHHLLKEFMLNGGFHTDIASTYGYTLTSRNEEGIHKGLAHLEKMIEEYPFVVDADEVREDLGSLLGEGIAEIRKDGKWGLVKKEKLSGGEDTIRVLFSPKNLKSGVMTFSKEEYDEWGLIELRKFWTDNKTVPYDTTFLQIKKTSEGNESCCDLRTFTIISDFDKDGIGIILEPYGKYYFISKYKVQENKVVRIDRLGPPFMVDKNIAAKGFDAYNTFEAEMPGAGKVIYKKKYDGSGVFCGISVFRKNRRGKEALIQESCGDWFVS